jgi:hypothetical protein
MAERQDPDRRLARQLASRRPAPSPDFTASLQDQLLEARASTRRPPYLWPLVLVYLGCGAVLLVLALAGALGGGPLA